MSKKQHKVGVQHTYIWADLKYTAELVCHHDSVYFIVFRIVKRQGALPLYQMDAEDLENLTADTDKAVPFFEGSMSWEGCLDLEFNQEPMKVHFCHYTEVRAFNRMSIRLHKAATALLNSLSI